MQSKNKATSGRPFEIAPCCAKIFDIMDLMKIVEDSFKNEKVASYPKFKAGDTIVVTYKIKEGDKFRLQNFRGVVIQISGSKPSTKTFTIRKVSGGVGVERVFPFNSPFIDSITVAKYGKVRRARIFYLRDISGKKARIKEKKMVTLLNEEGANVAAPAAETK